VAKLVDQSCRHCRLVITEKDEIESGGLSLLLVSEQPNILDRFPRYETSIDRAFDRTLTQLERYQRLRPGQPVAAPIKLDISCSCG
jgi:hypothetical protein